MSKKLIFVLMFVFFFSEFSLARADVAINEFVSHPSSGSEWVELLNTTGTDISLVGWKLTDLATPGDSGQHEVLNKNLDMTIPANGIIAVDITNLNDGGDSIGLYNGTTLIDRVTYGTDSTVKNYSINLIAPATGKSGALISNIWQTNQDPTKGVQNPIPSTSASTGGAGLASSDSGNNTASSSTTTAAKNKTEEPKIKTQIMAKTLGFVGLPLSFQAMTYGYSGEALYFGKYFWNFGDGDSKEINLADSQIFTHTYFYPGEYIVSLDYYSNYYQNFPDASSQMTIKIVPADIVISRVGQEKDFFVELANKTDYPANLSNWFLASDQKSFIIPRNTILASQKTMIISPRITNFSIKDKETLKLMTPEREVAFDYSASLIPVIATEAKTFSSTPTTTPPSAPLLNQEGDGGGNSVIPTENLPATPTGGPASAISSDILPDKPTSPYIPIIIFFVFIGVSASAVYFIRQKRIIPQSGNDFEILNE